MADRAEAVGAVGESLFEVVHSTAVWSCASRWGSVGSCNFGGYDVGIWHLSKEIALYDNSLPVTIYLTQVYRFLLELETCFELSVMN